MRQARVRRNGLGDTNFCRPKDKQVRQTTKLPDNKAFRDKASSQTTCLSVLPKK